MPTHEMYMKRCLQLAEMGKGLVAPNPMVGAVAVYGETIVGEGFHEIYGGPHAEVNALRGIANEVLKHSTLYVNLEPCSHYGKTPPCADLILERQIPRVVVAMQDPNPKVAGKGIEKLRNAGVEVITDVLQEEALFVNRRFVTYHQKHRPYIILKWAQTADGFISGSDRKPIAITGKLSQVLSHQWRTEEAAIMVGANTVRTDNPQLTARYFEGRHPVRITFDRKSEFSTYRIGDAQARTIFFTEGVTAATAQPERIAIDFSSDRISQTMQALYDRGIQSVIIEGGSGLLQSYINAKVWDEARVFTNNSMMLKDGVKAPDLNLENAVSQELGKDTLKIIYNK